jgi:hypothetical protein
MVAERVGGTAGRLGSVISVATPRTPLPPPSRSPRCSRGPTAWAPTPQHQLRRRQHLRQGHGDRPGHRRAGRAPVGQGLRRRPGHAHRGRPRRAPARPAARARQRLPRGRARGRDGRRVRLLPASARAAPPRRSTPRCTASWTRRTSTTCTLTPASRFATAADGEALTARVLRRPGRVGAVAASRLPARPRHRRDQGANPRRSGDPRRPRHHRLGRRPAMSARRTRWRSSHRAEVPRRAGRAAPVRPVRDTTRCRLPSAARGPRPWLRDPGPRLHGQAAGRPLHRQRPGRARLPRAARSTRPRRAGHVLPRPLPAHQGPALVLDLPPDAPLDDVVARLRELHAAYRADYRPTTSGTRPRTPRRCAARTRRSSWSLASACSASARTSRPRGWPGSSTSTRST